MTQLGEAIAISNISVEKFKCPFCNKDEHPFPKKQEVDISKIESKPSSLGCGSLSPKEKKGLYGRARHHLIPVHQCYTRIHRIASMGQAVGYDINGKQNGIPLPTAWNKYKVNGIEVNFGDIDDEVAKNAIRSEAMKLTGAQWHVGNHHYDMPEKEDTTEEMDDEGELDHKPYDEVVLWKLLDIADAAVSANLCEENDQNKIKEELDNLCKKIKSCLDEFKINPKKSKPYYVSKWAMAYKG